MSRQTELHIISLTLPYIYITNVQVEAYDLIICVLYMIMYIYTHMIYMTCHQSYGWNTIESSTE